MKQSNLSTAVILLTAILFLGCATEQVPVPPPPPVQVVEIIKKDLPVKKEFVGEVHGLFDIPIRARVDGFLDGMFFNEGRKVEKGQKLYLIDTQPYEASVAAYKSLLAEAKIKHVNAVSELNRIKPLAEINAVSQSDLDAAVAQEGAASAAVDAAAANLRLSEINLSYTRITSPITGLIGKSKAKTGEYVGKYPNPVVLNTISKIDTVLVQFFITEEEYLRIARVYLVQNKDLQNPEPSKVPSLELILSDGSIHEHKGVVDFIDREVDPTTGSMLVQASFPNPDGLVRPGQFAKIRVTLRIEEDAKIIPLRCIKEIQGSKNVFVVDENNAVQMRVVESTHTFGDLALIDKGLEHGERILLEGTQKVKSGMVVAPEIVKFESKSESALNGE